MSEILWSFAGGAAGCVVVVVLMSLLLSAFSDPESAAPTRGDDWIGFAIGLATALGLTALTIVLVPEASPFVENLGLGVGIGVMVGAPQFLALARGHRRAPEPEPAPAASPRRPGEFVVPVTFSAGVRRHFAAPEVRARYVIAAHRRGLIPSESVPGLAAELAPLVPDGAAWRELAGWRGGDGLDGAVDRAAAAIGYEPTEESDRAEVVERLVYWAMCSSDPGVRAAVVTLLAPQMVPGSRTLPDWEVRDRIDRRRSAVIDGLEVRYDEGVGPAVHRHFADPTVRARELIAAYRREALQSSFVPGLAAEIVADLPGAGEAWTELAMASSSAVRADLLPVLERAAVEIGYERTGEQAERDLLESAAYQLVLDGRTLDQSRRLERVDFEFGHDGALEAMRDARYLAGDDYFGQLRSVRSDVAAYLEGRYGVSGVTRILDL